MSKKLAVSFLLLSFLGQSMLANALPVLTTANYISVSTHILSSIPTQLSINESPCHEESHEETASSVVNNIELSSSLNLSINSDLESLEKHQHCKKNCHCTFNVHLGLFSAMLFKSFETNILAGRSDFLTKHQSTHPIKIPTSLLRPPSLS